MWNFTRVFRAVEDYVGCLHIVVKKIHEWDPAMNRFLLEYGERISSDE